MSSHNEHTLIDDALWLQILRRLSNQKYNLTLFFLLTQIDIVAHSLANEMH